MSKKVRLKVAISFQAENPPYLYTRYGLVNPEAGQSNVKLVRLPSIVSHQKYWDIYVEENNSFRDPISMVSLFPKNDDSGGLYAELSAAGHIFHLLLTPELIKPFRVDGIVNDSHLASIMIHINGKYEINGPGLTHWTLPLFSIPINDMDIDLIPEKVSVKFVGH